MNGYTALMHAAVSRISVTDDVPRCNPCLIIGLKFSTYSNIHNSVQAGNFVDAAEELIESDADVNIKSWSGLTVRRHSPNI